MKKLLVLCLCLSLFALSACGGAAETDANFPDTTAGGATEGGRPVAPGVTSGVSPTASPAVSTASGFPNIPESALQKIAADEAIDLANAVGDPGEGADNPVPDEAAPYVGLWHGSPVLGSGWNERYLLYYDGTFLWLASQMDGEARTRYV
jgi:hypothetical protein